MVIRISGPVTVTDENEEPIAEPAIFCKLDGAEDADFCANYLDFDLADLGVIGGTVRLIYDPDAKQLRVTTEYQCPVALTDDQLEQLIDETRGQWSDGIGENCFNDLEDEIPGHIDLCVDRADVTVEQFDDGREVKSPSPLAKAAREGDLSAIKAQLDAGADINARLLGYTPLHFAIIYCHSDAALELIEHGADVLAPDLMGCDALLAVAMGKFTDEESARIARELLVRGAPANGARGETPDYTPLFMAQHRKKTALETVLREFGATA